MNHIESEMKIIDGFSVKMPSKIKTSMSEMSKVPISKMSLEQAKGTTNRTLETIRSERNNSVEGEMDILAENRKNT